MSNAIQFTQEMARAAVNDAGPGPFGLPVCGESLGPLVTAWVECDNRPAEPGDWIIKTAAGGYLACDDAVYRELVS